MLRKTLSKAIQYSQRAIEHAPPGSVIIQHCTAMEDLSELQPGTKCHPNTTARHPRDCDLAGFCCRGFEMHGFASFCATVFGHYSHALARVLPTGTRAPLYCRGGNRMLQYPIQSHSSFNTLVLILRALSGFPAFFVLYYCACLPVLPFSQCLWFNRELLLPPCPLDVFVNHLHNVYVPSIVMTSSI